MFSASDRCVFASFSHALQVCRGRSRWTEMSLKQKPPGSHRHSRKHGVALIANHRGVYCLQVAQRTQKKKNTGWGNASEVPVSGEAAVTEVTHQRVEGKMQCKRKIKVAPANVLCFATLRTTAPRLKHDTSNKTRGLMQAHLMNSILAHNDKYEADTKLRLILGHNL